MGAAAFEELCVVVRYTCTPLLWCLFTGSVHVAVSGETYPIGAERQDF